MMAKFGLFTLTFLVFGLAVNGQHDNPVQAKQVDIISEKITGIEKSLNLLNERLKFFSETFTSNQGLRLSSRQQTILLSFEFLNRSEQRLANLRKLEIDLVEKQTALRLQLSGINEDLLPESIDRNAALRGSTNVEAFREIRRQALEKEKREISAMLDVISDSLTTTRREIFETEQFISRIRQRIFPAIEVEISDL